VRPYPRLPALVTGAAAAVVVLVLARRLGRVTVEGESMRPALEPGDRLLLVRRRRYRPGMVVAVADPRDARRLLVKRVVEEAGEGSLVVAGDDPGASTDSRTFGAVPVALVRGQAVRRYGPPGRVGPIPQVTGDPSLPFDRGPGAARTVAGP
jgi:nickel-type superoxide dismutase maturation protease